MVQSLRRHGIDRCGNYYSRNAALIIIGYEGWVEEHLGGEANNRLEEWTGSIAIGSRSFVDTAKARLGFRAKGRDIVESGETYHLRERIQQPQPGV